MTSVFFQICSLFYISLLILVFFSKKKLPSIENKIFIRMALANFLGLILDILSVFTIKNMEVFPFINMIVSKGYLVYLLTFISFMTIYIFYISKNNKLNNNNIDKYYNYVFKNMIIIYIISILLIIFLPLYFYNQENVVYSYGPAANFLYVISGIFILSWIFILFKNYKYIKSKKYLPMFGYMLIGGLVIYIQISNPEYLLMSSMETFVLMLMYFTIENPDVQIINELYRNKLLVEKTFEEKSNFLFKMTQEVKKPISNMQKIFNSLKDSSDFHELEQGIKLLNANSRQLDFVVNNVLDITTLDVKNIKIINNRYSVYNLFKDIEKRIQEYASNEVEFRFNIDDNIPYLYGDYIKLKQIIMSILLNSIKKTNTGFVELSINAIVKYDVCRLIIKIEDSGVGISLDKINEILLTTSEISIEDVSNLEKLDINLKLAQKIIKVLGGNLMLRSEEDKGTEVIITIDQAISDKNNNELDKYENMLYNYKKILIVMPKEEEIDIIKKYIKDKSIIVNASLYGQDAIDKIKFGKKYDLIIIEDEMEGKSGLTVLQEMKKIKDFKIPTVIMINKNKEFIKEHYIEDGFNDYIIKENISDEIEKILEKYC